MTSPPTEAPTPSVTPNALEAAPDQSHDVKAKVEACAEDLASTNDLVKVRIAEGETTLAATVAISSCTC
jgi:hypothetical protein